MTRWKLADPNGDGLGFQPGDRVELPDGLLGTVMQNYENEQNEDGTITQWLRVKKDDGQIVQAPDGALKFVQGLEGGMMPDTIPWDDAEQSFYRNAGAEEFHEDAARTLEEYEALARDIIKTLPPEEWPQWVKNYVHDVTWGKRKPIDWTPYDHEDALDARPGDLTLPDSWGKIAGEPKYPRNYRFMLNGEQAVILDPTQAANGKYVYHIETYESPDNGESWHAVQGWMTEKEIDRARTKMDQPGDLTLPWGEAEQDYYRTAAASGVPANYTPEDPLDLQGKQPLFDAMDTQWWTLPPEEAERAVVNAFRATMLSPRMNLKGNAVLYQSLMNVDPHESDPQVFENIIRDLKTRWDAQGQTGMGQEPTDVMSVDEILPGKFQPGIWTNIRRIAALGPYADEIYKAALIDMQQYGGSGRYFRDRILQLNIPGVKAKVASFAWLALAPNTSELGTIDVHMMRHLGEESDSPRNTTHYMQLEDQLRQERDDTYGTDVPLSKYQWGVWDKRRTPGFHQDHSPLRAIDPTPYTDVYWAPTPRPPRDVQPQQSDPNQMSLMGKVGWQIVKNPLSPAPVQWYKPLEKGDWNVFVYYVEREVGEANNPSIHDEVLRLTQGMVPGFPSSHSHGWETNRRKVERDNFMAGVKEIAQQLPVVLQNQIPAQDYRNVNDQEHADQFYNGIVPRDPTMRSQYPRQYPQRQIAHWSMLRLGGHTLQGQVVGAQGNVQGVAIRMDQQTPEEILQMLAQLPTHEQDYQKQREMIPGWAINRGGKVAETNPDSLTVGDWTLIYQKPEGRLGYGIVAYHPDREPVIMSVAEAWLRFKNRPDITAWLERVTTPNTLPTSWSKVADFDLTPDATGFTYGAGAIVVAEWVDVNDNWLLYHGAVQGIVAGKGGATSHGVVVARERNIPIIVNVQDWDSINAGDTLQMDATTGIIDVNGGSTEQQTQEVKQAEEPVIAFVWSQGHGVYQPVPAGSAGAAALHREMIAEMRHAMQFNKKDYSMGVVYADGRVQQVGSATDQEAMEQWLNTVYPTKNEPALTV